MDEGMKPEGEGGENTNVKTPDAKKIQDLKEAIKEAITSFEDAGRDLSVQILIWVIVCLFVIIGALSLYFCYFFKLALPYCWTWQVIFFSVIRLTFITAYFYVGIFCFKMLSSTFQLYQHNRHKVDVLKSLPSLIVASQHKNQPTDKSVSVNQDSIYNKMLDIILSFSNTGIIGNEHELKPTSDLLPKILDALLKILDKK